MSDKTKIILIQSEESIALSAYRDVITFGVLCAAAFFLNVVTPPSGWLNFALVIMFFLWLHGRSSRHVMTPEQAHEHLEHLAKENPDAN